jgi:hypothetical protein
MAETAPGANNRAIVYRGKPQREAAMPWTGKSFASKHNHALEGTPAAGKAAKIASAILKRGGDEGVPIATANKRVGMMRKRGRISDKAHAKHSAGLDSVRDVDAATA